MTKKGKKPFYKRRWVCIIALFVIFVLFSGGEGEKENATAEKGSSVEDTSTTEMKIEKKVPKEYQSALRKAEIYSDQMHMSKAAIYDQLVSENGEQFSEEAAEYAMKHLEADYRVNALKKAEVYQDDMAMSPDAIYDQLISEYGEQFTKEQAQYAIDHLEK